MYSGKGNAQAYCHAIPLSQPSVAVAREGAKNLEAMILKQ